MWDALYLQALSETLLVRFEFGVVESKILQVLLWIHALRFIQQNFRYSYPINISEVVAMEIMNFSPLLALHQN